MKKTQSNFNNFIWKTFEQYGVMGIQLIIQIILARVIGPNSYGIISVVSIFISISTVFIQYGFAKALIQKKDTENIDYSSVMFTSLIISIILSCAIIAFSKSIANYFEIKELNMLLKSMSVILLFGAISSVQNAMVQKKMCFKMNFISSIISVSISGAIGIFLAYNNYGVWALAIQQILYNLLLVITLAIALRWIPKIKIDFKRIKEMFSFGWKILVIGLVDEIFAQLRTLLISKKYNTESLAYYSKGQQFPNLFMKSINTSMQAVLLPVLSSRQDEKNICKNIVRSAIKKSTYIIYPALIGLLCVSNQFVSILLTDKWIQCAVYIRIFCIYYMSWPIITTNMQALYALGQSKSVMFAETIFKFIDAFVLIITMMFNPEIIAIGATIVSILSIIIYSISTKKYFDYKLLDQIVDIIPSLLLSIAMGLIVFLFGLIKLNIYLKLILQIIIGIFTYIILSAITKNENLYFCLELIKNKFRIVSKKKEL